MVILIRILQILVYDKGIVIFYYVFVHFCGFRPYFVYLVCMRVFQPLLINYVFLLKNEEGKRVLAINNRFEMF